MEITTERTETVILKMTRKEANCLKEIAEYLRKRIREGKTVADNNIKNLIDNINDNIYI